MPQQAPYFNAHGQVVYPQPSGRKGYYLDDSPLSHQLETTQARGRPRSNTAASEKLQISAGPAEPYRLALDGYTSGPAGHEGKGGFFSSFVSSIRSRSKSRTRDLDGAHFPARSSGSSVAGGPAAPAMVDSRGRSLHKSSRDPAEDLARQMEKDLRLQDMEDPYRPVRRDRSSSVNSRTSERRNRDLDPDVRDNTQYNAHALKFNTRMYSDPHHGGGGYHTDAQPQMLRRGTTSSRANPASHGGAPLIGWYNQRGDQFIKPGTVICQPKELQYSRRFDRYPEVGKGYGDAKGNVIDAYGHLIKRVG